VYTGKSTGEIKGRSIGFQVDGPIDVIVSYKATKYRIETNFKTTNFKNVPLCDCSGSQWLQNAFEVTFNGKLYTVDRADTILVDGVLSSNMVSPGKHTLTFPTIIHQRDYHFSPPNVTHTRYVFDHLVVREFGGVEKSSSSPSVTITAENTAYIDVFYRKQYEVVVGVNINRDLFMQYAPKELFEWHNESTYLVANLPQQIPTGEGYYYLLLNSTPISLYMDRVHYLNICYEAIGNGVLWGYVYETRERPLEGASVELANSHTYVGYTDAYGKYRITGIVPGTYKVTVSKQGYKTFTTTISISAGVNRKDFFLEKKGATVIVKLDSNYHGSDAFVEVDGTRYYYNQFPIFLTLTKDEKHTFYAGTLSGSSVKFNCWHMPPILSPIRQNPLTITASSDLTLTAEFRS
jgi:hypothetical protein